MPAPNILLVLTFLIGSILPQWIRAQNIPTRAKNTTILELSTGLHYVPTYHSYWDRQPEELGFQPARFRMLFGQKRLYIGFGLSLNRVVLHSPLSPARENSYSLQASAEIDYYLFKSKHFRLVGNGRLGVLANANSPGVLFGAGIMPILPVGKRWEFHINPSYTYAFTANFSPTQFLTLTGGVRFKFKIKPKEPNLKARVPFELDTVKKKAPPDVALRTQKVRWGVELGYSLYSPALTSMYTSFEEDSYYYAFSKESNGYPIVGVSLRTKRYDMMAFRVGYNQFHSETRPYGISQLTDFQEWNFSLQYDFTPANRILASNKHAVAYYIGTRILWNESRYLRTWNKDNPLPEYHSFEERARTRMVMLQMAPGLQYHFASLYAGVSVNFNLLGYSLVGYQYNREVAPESPLGNAYNLDIQETQRYTHNLVGMTFDSSVLHDFTFKLGYFF